MYNIFNNYHIYIGDNGSDYAQNTKCTDDPLMETTDNDSYLHNVSYTSVNGNSHSVA